MTARELCKQMRALLAQTPPQAEHLGDVLATWSATYGGQEDPYYSLYIGDPRAVVKLTPPALRRLADIKEALDRWLANEGPWPLSIKTEAKP